MSFVTWNVDGVRGKENDIDFICYVKRHDVIALLATWSQTDEELDNIGNMLDEYDVRVVKHGKKLSKTGRPSGGIVVFLKKICLSLL